MIGAGAISGKLLILLRFGRRLWVRVALMALLALAASIGAMTFEELIPQQLRQRFSPDAVMPVLTILASGMLAVSTFSLNVMVAAHHAAASQATPRAHRVLLADTTTQTVLATFIGAFVYSLSAIILFKAGLHAEGSSVTVMGATVAVVVLVILAMLRWIDRLSDLGSMDATLRATETEARSSLMLSRRAPSLGGSPLSEETVMPTDASPIRARTSGYLQFIDLPAMNDAAKDEEARLYIHTRPGDFVLEGRPVGYATGLAKNEHPKIEACLTIGQHRTFEQDATYGLLVLSEIASRALSPGLNDPGTAIDVIARQERLIWTSSKTPAHDTRPGYPRIFIPALDPGRLIDSAFASTARDGAGLVEVVRRLLRALNSLSKCADDALAESARDMAGRTVEYAERALLLEAEKEEIRREYARDGASTPSRGSSA